MNKFPEYLGLLVVLVCASSCGLVEGPLACADVRLEGALPIVVSAIDTRGEGDDYTPDGFAVGTPGEFEDLTYAWTPDSDGEYTISLSFDSAGGGIEDQTARKMYTLADGCGSFSSAGGVAGSSDLVDAVAGEPVVFVVENCSADCSITIDAHVDMPTLP